MLDPNVFNDFGRLGYFDFRWPGLIGIEFGKVCVEINENSIDYDNTESIKNSLIKLVFVCNLWYNRIVEYNIATFILRDKDAKIYTKFDLMIRKERVRQIELWGHQSHPGYLWISIIGEEFGEICDAFKQTYSDEDNKDSMNIAEEIIQLGAVCCAWYEHLTTHER